MFLPVATETQGHMEAFMTLTVHRSTCESDNEATEQDGTKVYQRCSLLVQVCVCIALEQIDRYINDVHSGTETIPPTSPPTYIKHIMVTNICLLVYFW